MTSEEIETMRVQTYDELCEEFLDQIFEFESKYERKKFQELVLEKQSWIFDTNDIREKIGWK